MRLNRKTALSQSLELWSFLAESGDTKIAFSKFKEYRMYTYIARCPLCHYYRGSTHIVNNEELCGKSKNNICPLNFNQLCTNSMVGSIYVWWIKSLLYENIEKRKEYASIIRDAIQKEYNRLYGDSK